MTSMPRKIIIDTDTAVGIPGTDADDAIAIYLALADPRLEVIGITTTFGNCPPQLSARCARSILQAVGRHDVPIAVGSPSPISGELPTVLSDAYAGARGHAGRIALPERAGDDEAGAADDYIIRAVRAHPGELTLVLLGPQTNLARALMKEPSIAEEIGSVVFMGGGLGLDPVYGRGNVTDYAECNVYFDPEAVSIVFESGIPLKMIGLDVTNPNTGLVLTEAMIAEIDRTSAAMELFGQICDTYLDSPMFRHDGGCVLYDPLAIAAAADPQLGTYERLALGVETSDRDNRGQTFREHPAPMNVDVMTGVDGAAAVREMIATIANRRLEGTAER